MYMYICMHVCVNGFINVLHIFLFTFVCIAQECSDHDPHTDSLHGADVSRDSFLGKPLFSLHREGAVLYLLPSVTLSISSHLLLLTIT